jgi:hypothetical protein
MSDRYVSSLLLFAAALLLSLPSFAQVYGPSTEGHRSPQTSKLAAAAPKPAYDPHDLTGVWWGRGNNSLMGNPVPSFTAEGQKMFALNRPTGGPNALVPALGNDPMGRCDPLGYPRTMYSNGRSFEFIQTPYKIVQIFEWTRGMRDIWIDGRKIPDDVDPRWYGYAVGKWDGNTLVVSSAGYNDKTWLDGAGHPHSEEMTMEERYTHPDAMTLQETMTINDPKIYTKPWVSAKLQTWQLQLPKGVTELEEAYCVPSEEEYFNEHTRNPAGGLKSQ